MQPSARSLVAEMQDRSGASAHRARMNLIRRRLLPALGAVPGVPGVTECAGGGTGVAAPGNDVADVTRRTAAAQAALVSGDANAFIAEIGIAKNYTLMAPFGGAPTHGFDASSQHLAALSRFFKSGTFEQEVVATHEADGLIVIVTIERVHAEVGGLPAQAWSLRVTQVFRRDAADWQLVHRHADPLANGISLQQAAVLARGAQR